MSVTFLVSSAQGLLAQADTSGAAGGDGGSAGLDSGTTIVDQKPIWELVMDGGWVMIPLGLMSLFAVYVFVERFLAIQKAQREEKNFMMQIKSFIQNADLNSARNLCTTTDHPIARMIGKGISKIGKPLKDIRTSIEVQGRLEVGVLEKRLGMLATIAGAAPMLGFLGTTLGMIRAFNQMSGMSHIKLGEIAPGIMEAMVTTVGGLIVGIIAYVAYNYLVAKVDRVVHTMEAHSVEFIDLLDEPGK